MKIRVISLAVAAAMSLPQAALALNPTGAFDIVFHLGGATAQENLIRTAIIQDIAVPGSIDLINGGVGSSANASNWGVAFQAKTTAVDPTIPALISGKKILFLKHGTGGSASGVNNLISGTAITFPDPSTAVPAGTAFGFPNWTTSGSINVLADAGISDVNPELFKGVNRPIGFTDVTSAQVSNTFTDASTPAVKGVVGQVFGIVVTTNLRDALQAAQGLTVGDETEANQPSLSKEFVASVFTSKITNWNNVKVNVGGVATALTALPGVTPPTDTAVKVVRRVPGSGTQATINNYIVNAPHSSGALTPTAGNTPNVVQGSGSGDVDKGMQAWNSGTSQSVKTDLGTGTVTVNPLNKTGWAIGIQGLERAASTHYRYVKLDGVAPSAQNAHDGKYQLWVESTIQYPVATIGTEERAFADLLKSNLSKAANVLDINNALPRDAYLALSTQPGNTPDAVWNRNNPVIGFTHTTSNTDNARIPFWNNGFPTAVPLPTYP